MSAERDAVTSWCAAGMSDGSLRLPGTFEPAGWNAGNAAIFKDRKRGLLVMLEIETHGGKRWLHVSVSRHSGKEIPTWAELCEVKDAFIGVTRKAIQVFPPASEHFSFAEVLHLWHCMGRDPLPDFRRDCPVMGPSI